MKIAVDENLRSAIVRGLSRRLPHLDMVTVQEAGLVGVSDDQILEWCTQEGRVLITHDALTIPKHASERIYHGLEMPGVIIVPQQMDTGEAIEQLCIVIECSLEGEMEGRILRLPL